MSFSSCKYADGQTIELGDLVDLARGFRETVVLSIFPPNHEISILYEMIEGCVELSPNTIEELPLDCDFQLLQRKPG